MRAAQSVSVERLTLLGFASVSENLKTSSVAEGVGSCGRSRALEQVNVPVLLPVRLGGPPEGADGPANTCVLRLTDTLVTGLE